jgi:hypothetical protein
LGYGYTSRFMRDIHAAAHDGRLPTHFRAADVRAACPGWAEWTYHNFLPKHRLGNPLGYTEYFLRHSDGTYSLLPSGNPQVRPAPSLKSSV